MTSCYVMQCSHFIMSIFDKCRHCDISKALAIRHFCYNYLPEFSMLLLLMEAWSPAASFMSNTLSIGPKCSVSKTRKSSAGEATVDVLSQRRQQAAGTHMWPLSSQIALNNGLKLQTAALNVSLFQKSSVPDPTIVFVSGSLFVPSNKICRQAKVEPPHQTRS